MSDKAQQFELGFCCRNTLIGNIRNKQLNQCFVSKQDPRKPDSQEN